MMKYFTANRLFFVWLVLAFILTWSAVPARAAEAMEVRVAVASNFIGPLQDLAARFHATTGANVVVSAGSTGKLYAQIKNGAPFDVFLAANAREPGRLEAEGAAVPGARFTYARGRLALWCISAQTQEGARACLQGDPRRIAIANPRLAPYGRAAESAMAALALDLSGRIVNGENIAQAFQLVWSGNVSAGFVALSQVKNRAGLRGAYWVVPPELHAPIDQQAVLLVRAKDNAAARAFLDYLKSAEARVVIEGFGYDASLQLAERR